MNPFSSHRGIAVPLDAINLDTDQILPARFLCKRRLDPDYSRYLFHDLRFTKDGTEIADFALNMPEFRPATIIVGNTNFGGGSSREAAAFALDAYGVRAVIAPNFGDIFHGNCVKNGIVPVCLPKAEVDALRAALWAAPGGQITVDLDAQTVIAPDGTERTFEIDRFDKVNLARGLSQIGLTLRHDAQIEAFENAYKARMHWM